MRTFKSVSAPGTIPSTVYLPADLRAKLQVRREQLAESWGFLPSLAQTIALMLKVTDEAAVGAYVKPLDVPVPSNPCLNPKFGLGVLSTDDADSAKFLYDANAITSSTQKMLASADVANLRASLRQLYQRMHATSARKIEAIKLTRQMAGCALLSAKAWVEWLEGTGYLV